MEQMPAERIHREWANTSGPHRLAVQTTPLESRLRRAGRRFGQDRRERLASERPV